VRKLAVDESALEKATGYWITLEELVKACLREHPDVTIVEPEVRSAEDAKEMFRLMSSRVSVVPAFKAVSCRNGKVFSLGMGVGKKWKASVIRIPVGEWFPDPAPYGISATPTRSGAEGVIRGAKGRKEMPVPRRMRVVRILGRGFVEKKRWRYKFREIYVLGGQPA
jgi:hypothetical protein